MHSVIGPVEAKKMMDSISDITIIDVRDEDELVEGYIEDSILIPLDIFRENIEHCVTQKDKTILVYCRSGRRSSLACKILDEMGYTRVYDFGGIINWPFEKIM